MRYRVEFGEKGADGVAIVHARKDDIDDIIRAAVKFGVGRSIPYYKVEKAFRKARQTKDPTVDRDDDVISWVQRNTDYRYIEGTGLFVDISNILYRPVAPNFKVGSIDNGRPPKLNRYRGRT